MIYLYYCEQPNQKAQRLDYEQPHLARLKAQKLLTQGYTVRLVRQGRKRKAPTDHA